MAETTDRLRFLLEEHHSDAVSLRHQWTQYQELYGNQKHVELMRNSARLSFGIFQGILRDSLILAIVRFLHIHRNTASLTRLVRNIP